MQTANARKRYIYGLWGALALLWSVCVGIGFLRLLNYSFAAGAVYAAPAHWPVEMPRQPGRAMLVMLLHPRCACSYASVAELAQLVTQLGSAADDVTVQVYFFKPAGTPDAWAQTGLWRQAAAIPGVHVYADTEGAQAGRFGAVTSGQVVLYGTAGELLFRGGITSERGHTGDNAGRSAIVALLEKRNPDASETPVFGCSITETGER